MRGHQRRSSPEKGCDAGEGLAGSSAGSAPRPWRPGSWGRPAAFRKAGIPGTARVTFSVAANPCLVCHQPPTREVRGLTPQGHPRCISGSALHSVRPEMATMGGRGSDGWGWPCRAAASRPAAAAAAPLDKRTLEAPRRGVPLHRNCRPGKTGPGVPVDPIAACAGWGRSFGGRESAELANSSSVLNPIVLRIPGCCKTCHRSPSSRWYCTA